MRKITYKTKESKKAQKKKNTLELKFKSHLGPKLKLKVFLHIPTM